MMENDFDIIDSIIESVFEENYRNKATYLPYDYNPRYQKNHF